jgi:aspartate/methionine/tyrosine aminotransferase
VPVFSDECYAEFTWVAPPATVLQSGLDGVVAVHSLSKRSNLAGLRVGFYGGDADIVGYLREVRKHVGMLVPGPAQAAAVVALGDDAHVEVQRGRYRHRLERLYLWFDAHDGWAFAERLAAEGGALVSPGDFYGDGGVHNVRAAVVQPDERIELIAQRLGVL